MEKNRNVRNQKRRQRHSGKDRNGKGQQGRKKKQTAGNSIQIEQEKGAGGEEMGSTESEKQKKI